MRAAEFRGLFARERRSSNPSTPELLLRCFGGAARTFICATCRKSSEIQSGAAVASSQLSNRMLKHPSAPDSSLPGAKWLLLLLHDNLFFFFFFSSGRPQNLQRQAELFKLSWTVTAGMNPLWWDLRVWAAALCGVTRTVVRYLALCNVAGKKEKLLHDSATWFAPHCENVD